jgi:RimJ/RimL family protein N-acetyltransferase
MQERQPMADSEPKDVCEFLEWDSQFFGMRVGRVKENRLESARASSVLDWCQSENIDCLYLLAEACDAETARVAEDLAFRFVDVRVTFGAEVSGIERGDGYGCIRNARADDVEAMKSIARTSHHATRFYFDETFPRERCDEMYSRWIERSCSGYADAVFVAATGRDVQGYATCHLADGGSGSIGLIAVAQAAQGRGYGQELVRACVQFMRDRGMPYVSVVTQGRNIASQRLYQKCGFKITGQQIWYHRWFTGKK